MYGMASALAAAAVQIANAKMWARMEVLFSQNRPSATTLRRVAGVVYGEIFTITRF